MFVLFVIVDVFAGVCLMIVFGCELQFGFVWHDLVRCGYLV